MFDVEWTIGFERTGRRLHKKNIFTFIFLVGVRYGARIQICPVLDKTISEISCCVNILPQSQIELNFLYNPSMSGLEGEFIYSEIISLMAFWGIF